MARRNVEELQKEIATKFDTLFNMPVKEWALRPALGEVNFITALPTIDRILGLLAMLREASLDFVGEARLRDLSNLLTEVTDQLKQIEAFKLNVSNPSEQRNNIVSTLENAYSGWFDRLHPIIGFSVRSATDFAALERDLRNKIAQAEVTAQELLDQQQSAVSQAQEALESIKRAAAEAGVSQEAVHFKNAADEHESTSIFWFCATIAMSVCTLAWGVVVVWLLHIASDSTTAQVVQQTVGKVIILSALYFGVVWCAKNYGASRHNVIVNRHRQNALSTFQTFVNSAATPEVKEAVLMQATTSIFTTQPSGYAGKESESAPPAKMIEIVRTIASGAKTVSS